MKKAQSLIEVSAILLLVVVVSLAIWPIFNNQKMKLANMSQVTINSTGSNASGSNNITIQTGGKLYDPTGAPITIPTGGAPITPPPGSYMVSADGATTYIPTGTTVVADSAPIVNGTTGAPLSSNNSGSNGSGSVPTPTTSSSVSKVDPTGTVADGTQNPGSTPSSGPRAVVAKSINP